VITIDSAPLGLDDLLRIADGAQVELGPDARSRIAAARTIVDAAVRGPDLVYGLNTGLGHLANTRVPDDEIGAYQDAIVLSHVGGFGPALPSRVVRAAMATRLAGIARGGAGATQAVADGFAALLNAHVHPVVPQVGSVGASDLMQMAAIGAVLIGKGQAEYAGRVLDGGEALRRAGIEPVRLGPKDGLAIVSANGVAVGHAAIVVARALDVADLADVVVAASLEAIGGNPSIVEPAIADAKPVHGQREAADHIRALLAGSERCVADARRSVQDALSFRVAPQVHGALRELVRFARQSVEVELGASDDNPLVSIEEARLISNGNFEPILMALAVDGLRPALAHVGQLSDRRLSHLWTADFGLIDPMASSVLRELQESIGGPLWRYAAAARYAELRELAAPATLDIGPLDNGVEDHATNAPGTVRRTEQALEALEDILAVELVMAREAVDPASGALGIGAQTAFGQLGQILAAHAGRASNDAHAAVRDGLRARILPAVRKAVAAS
jgi:histidine ammonia-lyase